MQDYQSGKKQLRIAYNINQRYGTTELTWRSQIEPLEERGFEWHKVLDELHDAVERGLREKGKREQGDTHRDE